MFHEEVGNDRGHWGTHGCAKFLLVHHVSECEASRVQNKVDTMMSSISSLVLSVKVVFFCSLVLIIFIALAIGVLVKRDNITQRENLIFV